MATRLPVSSIIIGVEELGLSRRFCNLANQVVFYRPLVYRQSENGRFHERVIFVTEDGVFHVCDTLATPKRSIPLAQVTSVVIDSQKLALLSSYNIVLKFGASDKVGSLPSLKQLVNVIKHFNASVSIVKGVEGGIDALKLNLSKPEGFKPPQRIGVLWWQALPKQSSPVINKTTDAIDVEEDAREGANDEEVGDDDGSAAEEENPENVSKMLWESQQRSISRLYGADRGVQDVDRSKTKTPRRKNWDADAGRPSLARKVTFRDVTVEGRRLDEVNATNAVGKDVAPPIQKQQTEQNGDQRIDQRKTREAIAQLELPPPEVSEGESSSEEDRSGSSEDEEETPMTYSADDFASTGHPFANFEAFGGATMPRIPGFNQQLAQSLAQWLEIFKPVRGAGAGYDQISDNTAIDMSWATVEQLNRENVRLRAEVLHEEQKAHEMMLQRLNEEKRIEEIRKRQSNNDSTDLTQEQTRPQTTGAVLAQERYQRDVNLCSLVLAICRRQQLLQLQRTRA